MKTRRLKKIEDEKWKEVTYSDKRYLISNYGRVKSFCYNKINGTILRPGSVKGFPSISFLYDGRKKTFLVHKLTAELFVDRPGEEHDTVIHLDWNKQNNYYHNLKWVTRKDSYDRMMKRLQEINKTRNKGIVRYSKLKPDDVKVLKSMLEKGVRQNLIARLFCISEMQVTRIKRGENWANV